MSDHEAMRWMVLTCIVAGGLGVGWPRLGFPLLAAGAMLVAVRWA